MSNSDNTAASTQPRSSSLLVNIKNTLSSTSPDRWTQAGGELDPSRKYQKPQEAWEQVYCTDVKSGVLVLRCSTPVQSNYFGGGYSLAEAGIPNYFVELRSRGWAPKMLLDPYYRSSSGVEKKTQTLVEGEIARQLYLEVDTTVRHYLETLKRSFHESVEALYGKIIEKVKETPVEKWAHEQLDRLSVRYTAEIDYVSVEVTHTVKDNSSLYHMIFTRYGLTWECRDSSMMKEVFGIVDESVKQASLEQLGKVLEEIL